MATLASAAQALPAWADELRRRYLRGESSQFVLHGNVHDEFLFDGKLYTLSEFLAQVLLERSKETIVLSTVNCLAICHRLAPSARRTAISFWRPVTRARIRLATLAQASRSTKAAPPISVPTNCCEP